MLYSFSNFSSPTFSSSFLSTLPSLCRRLLYHSPAFDPFAPFTETFGFTGVDYPMSQVGSGAGAYLKAMGKSNTIAFYRNHFCLLNITPHILNRMRKTRRRLFYVTHYCTLFRQGQHYTIELMWPVWVGKAPKGVLTQTMPGWHNPFLKDEWQEFHIAEFAFVNLRYLWPYDHSWQRLDINRSPLAPGEMKTWWKESFLPAVKIRSEDTFGYSIFRFSEGYHDAPSHIPPMAYEAEKHFAPETDRYKAAMGAVAAQASEVPEHYWWTPHDGATLPFIRKWEPLGLEVVPPLKMYYSPDSRLPDGHLMDPLDERLGEFFDNMMDPSTAVLRSDYPPVQQTPAEHLRRNFDKDYEILSTQDQLDIEEINFPHETSVQSAQALFESPEDKLILDVIMDSSSESSSSYDPDSSSDSDSDSASAGPLLQPEEFDRWIAKPHSIALIKHYNDRGIARDALKKGMFLEEWEKKLIFDHYIWQLKKAHGTPNDIPEPSIEAYAKSHFFSDSEESSNEAAIEANEESYLSSDPDLEGSSYEVATAANEESYLLSDSDSEWSSDEEAGYSASWMKWGDATEFQEAPLQLNAYDLAEDLLEDWALALREECGSINDTLDFGEFQDYDPEPEPNRYFQDFVDPREWPEPDVGGTFPVYHDPRIDYSQETRWSWFPDSWAVPKKAEDFFLWQDGRREE